MERKSFESSKSPDDDCENKVIHPKYYKYLANILALKLGFVVTLQPNPGFRMENQNQGPILVFIATEKKLFFFQNFSCLPTSSVKLEIEHKSGNPLFLTANLISGTLIFCYWYLDFFL